MEKIVISLGGSLIVPQNIDIEFLKKFKDLVIDFVDKKSKENKKNKGNSAAIICGGGSICRAYQKSAEMLGVERKKELDWIGIKATKLNAEVIRAMFGEKAHELVLDDPSVVPKTDKKIIIGSGHLPGSSSDLDAILLGKALGADIVINMTNVDYVYDKDPQKFKDAKELHKLNWQEFRKIVGKDWTPGANLPFDPIAAEQAEKDGIKVVILNGKKLDNLKNFLDDKEFIGSIIE